MSSELSPSAHFSVLEPSISSNVSDAGLEIKKGGHGGAAGVSGGAAAVAAAFYAHRPHNDASGSRAPNWKVVVMVVGIFMGASLVECA